LIRQVPYLIFGTDHASQEAGRFSQRSRKLFDGYRDVIEEEPEIERQMDDPLHSNNRGQDYEEESHG
jgi:hypothetical protein